MRKRTVKLWRLHDDGRKLYAGTIEAADPRELVIKWSAFLATAERGVVLRNLSGQLHCTGTVADGSRRDASRLIRASGLAGRSLRQLSEFRLR